LERFSLEQVKEVGVLLFGCKTYEGMAAYWSTTSGNIAEFMNSVPKVVFSNTLEEATWSNTRLVKGRAEDEVVRLKGSRAKIFHLRQCRPGGFAYEGAYDWHNPMRFKRQAR
jgi:dihydrofolate reductase